MPKGRRGRRAGPQQRPLNMGALNGMPRIVARGGKEYSVSRVRGSDHEYTCPACLQTVAIGSAHVVVWRTDSAFESGPEYRRHWHSWCWDRGLNPIP